MKLLLVGATKKIRASWAGVISRVSAEFQDYDRLNDQYTRQA